MSERAFQVKGLCCGSEVKALKRELGPRVGGEEHLLFDLLRGRMTVLADPGTVPDEAVIAGARRAGLDAEPEAAGGEAAGAGVWERHGRAILAAASGALLLAAFLVHARSAGGALAALAGGGAGPLGGVPPSSALGYGLSVVAGVWYVLPKAWASLRALRPDMNLLMTIAVAGAIGIGEWFEAATVAFLFAVALLLETWSVGRARRAVEGLLEAAPPVARMRQGEREIEVSPEHVPVGSTLIVRPGERIPLDGEILTGASDVNQAPITGESAPISKQAGEGVFAGTVNGDGLLEIRTTRAADQTTLAHVIRLITAAQSRRAPSEQWVDRFARIYTPAVIALALLVMLVPPLSLGAAWGAWFYRGLVLLVIACPCALVISTPVSVVAALASAAHHGVLVKGGAFMEAPARLDALALDKTGTLTEGRPRVAHVVPLGAQEEDELLAIAAALEAGSNHPLAQAITDEAARRGLEVRRAEDHRAVPGLGVDGRLEGAAYWLGSDRYLAQRGQETDELRERIAALADHGHSVVLVGAADGVRGLIALADAPRPGAREAIAALRDLGVPRIAMLTGDNRATAEAVAQELGIDEVHAELLPEDKVAAVEAMGARHGRVAMVGDGVNDAPALAASSLGIAMRAAGSDAAIETADVALMSDDLDGIPWLVGHARATLRVIYQNVALALAIKALFVGLTLFGMATLWMAIAADMGTSLAVIFNGLRLLRGGGGAGRPVPGPRTGAKAPALAAAGEAAPEAG